MRQARSGCSNCGGNHGYRQCMAPITSHGVIAIRVRGGWNPSKVLAEQESAITGFEGAGPIEYLLIQRRDSLGFVEMMRGKYSLTDYIYIIRQLKGMTVRERENSGEQIIHIPSIGRRRRVVVQNSMPFASMESLMKMVSVKHLVISLARLDPVGKRPNGDFRRDDGTPMNLSANARFVKCGRRRDSMRRMFK